MIKTTLSKFLFIVAFCTLIFSIVSAHTDEDFVDNSIDDNEFLNEIRIDTSDGEENLRNIKMPHVDGKKEKIVPKIEIPKIIHQYVKSKDNISSHIQKNIDSWKSINNEWEHKLYDYSDIKSFMETKYSKYVDLWNALDYEEKIHMWKYAVLEIEGGAYVNSNCYCTKPFNQWLNKYNSSNIIIGLDYLYIPDQILNEKKLTDSIRFNIRTIISAPGHEILTKMNFYIHRYRVLGTLNAIEADPDYKKYGRTYFSAGAALFTESTFDYLIENNVVLENIVHGGLVKDVAILNPNAFSYQASDMTNLPDDVYSFYYPEKEKIKEKNDYII